MFVLVIGVTLPLALTQGQEVRGGRTTLFALWGVVALAGVVWLLATDYANSRLLRVLSWLPTVKVAKEADSLAIAVTKPRRFIRPIESKPISVPTTSPEPRHRSVRRMMWIAEVSTAERRGKELAAELLRARRRPNLSPFPGNAHLSSVAQKIRDWNTNEVAGLVDSSNLPHAEKIKLPIYTSPMMGRQRRSFPRSSKVASLT